MKRTPIVHGVAVSLVFAILVAQGCRQERETPKPPPPQLTATTSQASASPAPEPPPDDEGKADRIAINRCCAALQNKLNTAAADQKGTYALALGVCNASRGSRKGKTAALAKVREALGEVKPPGACR